MYAVVKHGDIRVTDVALPVLVLVAFYAVAHSLVTIVRLIAIAFVIRTLQRCYAGVFQFCFYNERIRR